MLTFNGDRWVSRTSGSLLRAAGLEEWDVASKEEYVRRAVELVTSPETHQKLAELRSKMRKKLLASLVCDTTRLCRDLEGFYELICGSAVNGSTRLRQA